MAILSLHDLSFGYGDLRLIEAANLQIEPGERIALVGRNGAGKSTLMKLLRGELDPEDGTLRLGARTKVAYLLQEIPRELDGTVYDVVASGLLEIGDLLAQYHHVSHELAMGADVLDQLEKIQHRLEAAGGWLAHRRVENAIEHLQLPADRPLSELSGGMIRRVLLARELVCEPDLLLLDEPTNHLDISAIEWLEEFLLNQTTSLLFVTHDRRFLERLATRIIELDRGKLTSWPGDYATYLRRKQEALEVEAEHAAQFDKKLAKEEAWIRQGIKARRTRNEGRVRALHKLREERRARRQQLGAGRFQSLQGERSGKIVVEAQNLRFSFDSEQPLINDFSTLICRGDRVGIIGPNGSGKTTLIRLLLGELQPDEGNLRLGTRLEVAYFDQYRAQLDEEATVADNVARAEYVTVGGKKRHVISYLSDFLFTGAQCRGPIHGLSGGERNRLMLAKLFVQPSNVLVMDEPTNDLDVETLELLEEILVNYEGTVLLVSHDRAFLDNVVTSSLVMEGKGRVGEFVGGYADWIRQRQADTPAAAPQTNKTQSREKRRSSKGGNSERPAKLSFKEKRELETLPATIEELETEQSTLHAQLADPEIYRTRGDEVGTMNTRLAELEAQLATAYERWEDLEGRSGGG